MDNETLKPCPFCGAELTVVHPVRFPKFGLARMHPGSLDDGSCPISGWGFYAEQLGAWNTRAPVEAADLIERQAAEIERLRRNIKGWLEWHRRCDADDDCTYLNDNAWCDAEALASSGMGILARAALEAKP